MNRSELHLSHAAAPRVCSVEPFEDLGTLLRPPAVQKGKQQISV